MTRDEWRQAEEVLNKPDVKLAMRARCEEQGHDWENGADIMFNVYMFCKWCGKRR